MLMLIYGYSCTFKDFVHSNLLYLKPVLDRGSECPLRKNQPLWLSWVESSFPESFLQLGPTAQAYPAHKCEEHTEEHWEQ